MDFERINMKAKEHLNKNRDWDFRCPITEFGVAKIMTEYAEAQNKELREGIKEAIEDLNEMESGDALRGLNKLLEI